MKVSRFDMRLMWILALVVSLWAWPRVAMAQGGQKGGDAAGDLEEGLDDEEGGEIEAVEEDVDRELYIKNIVHSATKSVTTVQEAPAVINIITAEDMAAFGYRNLLQALTYLPGVVEANSQYDMIPFPTIRGVNQAVLYLRDGISLFDPLYNIQASMRRIPLETIKRVEMTTSPGGVLWGANSFLGIMNVITKDPADVNGFEMAVGGGTGPGDESVIRPYIMYGKSFFGGRFQLLAHWSVEYFKGPKYRMPYIWLYSPPPRINSMLMVRNPYGVESRVPMSMYSQVDGKVVYAKPGSSMRLALVWQYSFTRVPYLATGQHNALSFLAVPMRNDGPVAGVRENNLDFTDSYVFLQFKDRWLGGKMGMDSKAYYVYFRRLMQPTIILPATEGVFNGIAFANHHGSPQRAGVTLDMDYLVHRMLRLQWGGEVFYEWLKNADVTFTAPLDDKGQLDYSALSVVCPYYNDNGDGLPVYDPANPENTTYVPGCRQPFVFDVDRLVYALYLSGEFRPHKSVILDAGVRIQHAPWGIATYKPQILYSAAAVWNFYKEFYLKANYATGFRAPVFNNTSSNGATINYAGNPHIKTEKSQAVQVELSARLLRDTKYVRQWDMRVDYSYTVLDRLIRIYQGRYVNLHKHDVHSVEFQTQLYLKGGHRLQMAYTFATRADDTAIGAGAFRSFPNHWFAAGGVFNLMDLRGWRLDLNSTFRIISAFEDPNRLIVCSSPTATSCSGRASDLTYDRIPPTSLLNVGLRLRGRPGGVPLEFTANTYNVLDDHWWAGDYFYDLGAKTEVMPTPGPRFYFYLQGKALF